MNFNSAKLQNCFELIKPIINDINKTKDIVSEDINLLEEYLRSIKLNDPIKYIISDPESYFTIDTYDDYKMISSCTCIEELLVWDVSKKRLIFVKNKYSGTIYHEAYDTPSIENNSRKSVIYKPLIETPFEIRKQIYENDHLTSFLQNIAKTYDVHNKLDLKMEP